MSDNFPLERNPAIARLCRCDPLSPEEERRLFGRLKHVKAQAIRLSRLSTARSPRLRRGPLATSIAALRDEAVAIRNQIIESNLRLVVSLARHYAAPERPLEDLVSEAAMPLLRCVESFDAGHGTRFSTYATRALTNFFSRLRRRDARLRSRFALCKNCIEAAEAGEETNLSRMIRAEDLRRLRGRLARLPARERMFVTARFGLTGNREPLTFRELGALHGLSKERVRVVTSEAIARLKQSLE